MQMKYIRDASQLPLFNGKVPKHTGTVTEKIILYLNLFDIKNHFGRTVAVTFTLLNLLIAIKSPESEEGGGVIF